VEVTAVLHVVLIPAVNRLGVGGTACGLPQQVAMLASEHGLIRRV